MPRSRFQFGLALLTGCFLLATLFAVMLYRLVPATASTRGPILLTTFVALLIGGLICILVFLRWLVRPYRQLVGEAERAPVAAHTIKSKDEAQFVLETFQSVVAQLQAQQRELERLTAQASERAESAERFSERIVASVPSGLVAFDGSGRSIAINAPGRALLELSGEAMNEPVHVVLANLPRFADMVGECLKTGKLYRREEIEVTGANGVRRLGATIAPIDLAPERGAQGALCLLTDITEVTELREQVTLKRNLESLGEMSAGLAHEFKNTIATLHGYAQLLLNLELGERGQVAATSLLSEVRNLSEMITSFLNFARPQPLQLETVALADLIEACADELAPLYEQRHVDLHIEVANHSSETDQLEVCADERMLRQALLNMIRNAAEAIPEEQHEGLVEVRTFNELDGDDRPWAVVEVKDNGEGIPAADLQRIFIPFFTTKATGHGVGLALAHRVITEHGGTLTATNGVQSGAVFTIRLPRQALGSA